MFVHIVCFSYIFQLPFADSAPQNTTNQLQKGICFLKFYDVYES